MYHMLLWAVNTGNEVMLNLEYKHSNIRPSKIPSCAETIPSCVAIINQWAVTVFLYQYQLIKFSNMRSKFNKSQSKPQWQQINSKNRLLVKLKWPVLNDFSIHSGSALGIIQLYSSIWLFCQNWVIILWHHNIIQYLKTLQYNVDRTKNMRHESSVFCLFFNYNHW